MRINTFDIDGVVYLGPGLGGVHPGPSDIIITGRSLDEELETRRMLVDRGIYNQVYFNPLPFEQKTRQSSGEHKANIIKNLQSRGYEVVCHFEDDEIQVAAIRAACPTVTVVHLVHDLTEKENVRHEYI